MALRKFLILRRPRSGRLEGRTTLIQLPVPARTGVKEVSLSVAHSPLSAARAGSVPLAWRNLVSNKPRLLRSAGGIGFAVLLMLMQLGFEQAFFESSLEVIRGLDGDLFIQSTRKYQFATRDPFPRSDLDKAAAVAGVASARPLYADWFDFFWTNPFDGKVFLVRAFGFDPDAPVFRYPDVNANREKLSRARNGTGRPPRPALSRYGRGRHGSRAQRQQSQDRRQLCARPGLSERRHRHDERPYLREPAARAARESVGGRCRCHQAAFRRGSGAAVQQALRKALPDTIAVFTKPG